MNHNELLAEAYAIERGQRLVSLMEWAFAAGLCSMAAWMLSTAV